jgi:hypothetical protein
MKEMKMAASFLGIRLQPVQLRVAEELESAFAAMAKGHAAALVGLQAEEFSIFESGLLNKR